VPAREDKIIADGKSELQTYWLIVVMTSFTCHSGSVMTSFNSSTAKVDTFVVVLSFLRSEYIRIRSYSEKLTASGHSFQQREEYFDLPLHQPFIFSTEHLS
jgi:hypothetical protein